MTPLDASGLTSPHLWARQTGSRRLSFGLAAIVALLAVLSLGVGPTGFAPLGALVDLASGRSTMMTAILVELRLPRVLLALAVGGTLGLAGAVMQGFLRNPLAEPGVLGVSSCAAFGAVAAFYGGLSAISAVALPLGGIAGALLGSFLVAALAGRGASPATLILMGVAINALAAACTALVLSLSTNPFAFYEVSMWLMGSIADRPLPQVLLLLPFVLVGGVVLWLTRQALDALILGEEGARGLGIDLVMTGRLVLAGTALAVGATVAASGVVGFVGLMAPHAIRAAVGHRPSTTLGASMLAGMVLVLAADIAVRLLPTAREIQLGVLTAMLGAPFLSLLVMRRRGGGGAWS